MFKIKKLSESRPSETSPTQKKPGNNPSFNTNPNRKITHNHKAQEPSSVETLENVSDVPKLYR